MKSTILPVFIVTMIVLSPFSVKGEFTEDFTDPPEDWYFFAQNDGQWTNTTWSVSGGVLNTSSATMSYNVINYACVSTGYDVGIWNFDFFGPQNPFVFGFRIASDPDFETGEEGQEGAPHWTHPNYTQVVVKVGLSVSNDLDNSDPIIINDQLHSDKGRRRVDEFHLDAAQIRGWHHVQIVKNDTGITAYLDNFQVIDGILSQTHDAPYSWVCIWTLWGLGVAFDNISIKDLQIVDNTSKTSDSTVHVIVMISSIVSVSTFTTIYRRRSTIPNVN